MLIEPGKKTKKNVALHLSLFGYSHMWPKFRLPNALTFCSNFDFMRFFAHPYQEVFWFVWITVFTKYFLVKPPIGKSYIHFSITFSYYTLHWYLTSIWLVKKTNTIILKTKFFEVILDKNKPCITSMLNRFQLRRMIKFIFPLKN